MDNREIKFRIWCPKIKKMARVSHLGWFWKCEGKDEWESSGVASIDAEIHNGYIRKSFGCGNGVVMQYTGLTDKDGKEIYEGDILEHDNFLAEVVWVVDGWELIIHPKSGKQEHGGRLSTYVEQYEIEVIGNKFENKL